MKPWSLVRQGDRRTGRKEVSWSLLSKFCLPFLVIMTIAVMGIVIWGSVMSESTGPSLFSLSPVMAQVPLTQPVNSSDVWQQVYQELPDLPRENQYVSKETRKVDLNNTLVKRLIKYHIFVKGRPPNYRLDWKLTLADYLGANEIMYDGSYPDNDTLKTNPIDGDRHAIERLNRRQRDALVEVLVNIFNHEPSP